MGYCLLWSKTEKSSQTIKWDNVTQNKSRYTTFCSLPVSDIPLFHFSRIPLLSSLGSQLDLLPWLHFRLLVEYLTATSATEWERKLGLITNSSSPQSPREGTCTLPLSAGGMQVTPGRSEKLKRTVWRKGMSQSLQRGVDMLGQSLSLLQCTGSTPGSGSWLQPATDTETWRQHWRLKDRVPSPHLGDLTELLSPLVPCLRLFQVSGQCSQWIGTHPVDLFNSQINNTKTIKKKKHLQVPHHTSFLRLRHVDKVASSWLAPLPSWISYSGWSIFPAGHNHLHGHIPIKKNQCGSSALDRMSRLQVSACDLVTHS